jgi:membrane-associated phospholipid phosphatase
MKKLFTATACALLFCATTGAAMAQNKALTTGGTGLAIALPIIAGGISLYKDDWTGIGQLTIETAATVGTAEALKYVVHERRPDGSDYQSFPSDTTALAASGSSYLWKRYGWQYGLPAFLATQLVSYSRVDARKHHWYDTLASSAISFGYTQLLVSRYHERGLNYGVYPTEGGAMASVQYKF